MKHALDDPKLGIKVIDVREADEYEIAKVEGVLLLPLSQINERFTELDPNQSSYIHCQAGVRSFASLLPFCSNRELRSVALSNLIGSHLGRVA